MKKNNYHIFAGILFLFLLLSANSRSQNNIVITEVLYDTPLEEENGWRGAHNGEFVELYNPTTESIDISGWGLRTISKYAFYTFPAGTVIPSCAFLIVAYRNADTPFFQLKDVYPEAVEKGNNKIIYQNNIFFGNGKNYVRLITGRYVEIDRVSYTGVYYNDQFQNNDAWKLTATNLRKYSDQQNSLSVQRIAIPVSGNNYSRQEYFTVAKCTPFSQGNNLNELTLVKDPYNPETFDRFSNIVDVGAIAGQLDVSPSGVATYQIPIEIPPGINGCQPSISLVYNSQAGNGIAGWGFNIAGLSAITRVPQTIYSDDAASGIKNTTDDKYALDGNRLINVNNGTYGANNTEYRTEVETFNKIVSYGSYGNNGPEWFEVTDKNGTKYKYGSNSGKLLYSRDGKTSVQSWNLDYVENVDNTNISYEYENINQVLYIKKISYGDYFIEFTYVNRSDTISYYFDGKKSMITKILDKIEVKSATQLYRKYQLDYTKDVFCRLQKITESNGEGKSFNPTIFNWGNFPTNANITTTDVSVALPTGLYKTDFSEQTYFSVDLNGDGLSDMISYYLSNNIPAYQKYIAKKVNGIVSFYEAGGWSLDIPSNSKDIKIGGFLSGNVEYPSRQCAILPSYQRCDVAKIVSFHIFGDQFGSRVDRPLVLTADLPVITTGDIYNTGFSNIIYIEKGKDNSGKYILKILESPPERIDVDSPSELKYSFFDRDHDYFIDLPANPTRMFVADFDGDGMNDIMVLTEKKGYTIFWNQGGKLASCFSNDNKTSYTEFSGRELLDVIALGDYNGDGLPDFVVNTNNNADWYVVVNNGDKTFTKTKSKVLSDLNMIEDSFTTKNDDKDHCMVADFNGDGKSDLIISDAKYINVPLTTMFIGHIVYWLRSTGTDFELVKDAAYDKEDALSKYFVSGDFTGGGQQELMFYGYDCYNGSKTQKWRLYKNPGFTDASGKITQVTDGLNNKTKIEYKPLTNPAVYTKGGANYPVISITAPIPVVSAVKGEGVNITYAYEGAKVHLQGKGFLGFENMFVTDNVQGIKTSLNYELDNTYYYPFPKEKTITLVDNGKDISKENYTNKIHSYGGKHIFPYTEKVETQDYPNDVKSIRTQMEYDFDNGNIKEETAIAGVLLNSSTNGEVVVNTKCEYDRFGGNGYKNKLTKKTTTTKYLKNNSTLEYEPPFVQQQQYRYDQSGRLTAEIANAGTPDSVTTSYLDPNKLKLPETIKVSARDKVSGETIESTGKMKYDDYGRVLEKTNSLGQTQTYAYNPVGLMTSQTDHLNNTTSYGYDSWGKQSGERLPTGPVNTIYTDWVRSVGESTPPGALYYTYSESLQEDLPYVTTYYDFKGREMRSITIDAFNKRIFIDTRYNDKGQVSQVSLPYFQGETPEYTTYKYDEHGRKIEEQTKNSIITTTEYDKRTVTTKHPDGNKSIQTVNAAGNVIEAEDAMGNITTYAYHSSGQPREVSAVGSSYTMEYDDLGRQTKLIDPNAGETDYRYDAFGNVVWQKDGRGIETSTVYDEHGRVTESKTGTEFTKYRYNQYGVDSVLTASAFETFSYDRYGRVTSHEQSHSGTGYKTGYAYDVRNNITQQTYPSGITVDYSYKIGYLTGIYDNKKQTVWELKETNALGQPLQYNWGNGIATKYAYDEFDNLSSKVITGISEMYYSFDANTGNLKYRQEKHDNKFLQEYFEYDKLNRLRGWKSSPGGNPAYETSYLPNGNIDYKTGIGEYKYNGTNRPHALDSIINLEGYAPSFRQSVRYNVYNKVQSISEDIYTLSFAYGADQQRFKTFLYKNGSLAREKHFADSYEVEIAGDKRREIHYIQAPTGLVAVLIRSNNTDSLFYVCTDHLGSIVALADSKGKVLERHSYDAWGRERNPDNWENYNVAIAGRLDRGFTGHEHLREFGLINMNARLYDPVLGRFLSPDPYVQAPDFSQSFNRYSYCLNNPLKYVDPDGEWFGIDDLIVAGAGFITGYLSHGFSTGNWGWKAIASGGIGAASAWLGFNTMGASSAMSGWQFAGYNAANTAVSSFMPSASIPINDHFTLSVSPGFMFGPTGATAGINYGLTYQYKDFAIGAGFGVSNAYTAWNVSAMDTRTGYGLGYGQTHYGASEIMGHQFGAQTTGTIIGYFNHNSLNWTNDATGDTEDRWRTNAVELTIGKWSVGTYLYTNYGKQDSGPDEYGSVLDRNENCIPPIVGKNKDPDLATWRNGRSYYAPLWIGYRNGNQVTRVGFSHPMVQNLTQNLIHKFTWLGHQNYYMMYDEFKTGGFYSTGTYNPFSLYNR
ncbi:MAG: polymorphic toxin type 23 domain-containing protein [Candidatus Azobacteroides sp.]|nr:polymorphic toxin type 23 domain-containing protein [Candidatus Azobacteroides sp.]